MSDNTLHPSISKHGHICEGGSMDGQSFTLTTGSTGDITTGTERYVHQAEQDFQGRWIWKCEPGMREETTNNNKKQT